MEAGRANPATERNWQHPDLRGWLQRLVATDRLVVAREGVSLIDELAAVAKKLELENAVLFPKPGGHAIPVVANLFADRNWIADSLGVPASELLSRFQNAVRHPLPWVEVTAAPAQDVVHREVDLLKQLPIPKHNEHDSGPYITAALLIARNPATGIQNVSIHRCQVSGPDRIGVLLLPRHTKHYFRMAEEAGAALEIALVIGVHPACILASQAIAALDDDEMEIAGALLGQPIEMVKCRTNSVRVPAHAEIVIEGRILPKVREPEGPFGEFPQYYGPRADREVIHVDAITHRKNAIFHTIVGGGVEHLLLGGIPREATLLEHLQRSFPSVRDVRLTRGGTCRYHLAVKIDKASQGEPKKHHHGRLWWPLRHQARRRGRHGCRYRRSHRDRVGDRDAVPGRSRSGRGFRRAGLEARSVVGSGHQRQDGHRRHQAGCDRADGIQAYSRQGH